MHNVPIGDLRRHVAAIRPEIDEAVTRVLDSGWYVLGPEVESFEQEFAAHCGVKHAIGVASGAEALFLALAALDIGPGDEVITVANACTYQLSAIEQTGAKPVFVDVTDDHLMDAAAAAAACTPRTKALLPVHLYGAVAPMRELCELARREGLTVIEDAAQAHGAWRRDTDGTVHRAGVSGTLACFSFYPSKNLGAIGDAGAVTTNDDELAERVRRLRMYGWQQKYVLAGPHGRNSRLDELQAAILRVGLRHLDDWNAARRERAGWYQELVDTPAIVHPAVDDGHVYHLYVVQNDERDRLRAALAERGIATDVHYPVPSHRQAGVAERLGEVSLPVTERLVARILSLPMFPELDRDEIESVAASVNELSDPMRRTGEPQDG